MSNPSTIGPTRYYVQHSPERFAPVVLVEAGAFRPAVIIDGRAYAFPTTVTSQQLAHEQAVNAYDLALEAASKLLRELSYRPGQLPRGGRYLPAKQS